MLLEYVIDKEHIFLFIGGLHRSGTSLLHRCISNHPEVSGFSKTRAPKDEGQHLQDVYPPAPTFGGPGFFGFDSRSYLDETSQLVSRENGEKLFDEWSKHWDLSKPILAEKSPPNLVRARFLQALFPRTRFVMILRHPIAVSFATQKWTDFLVYLTRMTLGRGIPLKIRSYLPTLRLPVWLLIKHWIICHKKFREDSERLENLMVLKYEDLTENTKETLNKVWGFLDLDTLNTEKKIRRGVNQEYFEQWERLTEGGGLAEKFYSKYVIPEYEDKVNEFGYSLSV